MKEKKKNEKIEESKGEVLDVEFDAKQREKYEQLCEEIQRDCSQIKLALVKTGMSLYEIERTKSFKIDNYETIQEMASKKFNIGTTYCNQCINICKKFGRFDEKTGECLGLKEKYEVYNTSQLCEMLSMKEELRQKVSSNMTIARIRELKKEDKQKQRAEKGIFTNKTEQIFKAPNSEDVLEVNKETLLEKIEEFKKEHPTTEFEISVSLVYTE